MRPLTVISGFFVILPAALVAAFYSHRLLLRLDSYPPPPFDGYRTGLLFIVCAFVASFGSLLLVGFLSLVWRSSVPRFMLLVAILFALISLCIIFLDPMGRIHAFAAD
jgi:hypothetical protein